MEITRILLLCVGAAAAYGTVHDQVTARLCVEYFTVGHPPVFRTSDPTLLGLGWGVIATWWVGAILWVPLSLAARAGDRPKRTWRNLVRPVGALLLAMAIAATIAGFVGYRRADAYGGYFNRIVAPERKALFIANLWAHTASYGVGFFGGLALCVWVFVRRRPPPETATGSA